MRDLFWKMEMPLVRVLAEMEMEGVAIDVSHLKAYSEQLESETKGLEASIKELAGMDFNVDSPKQ